MSETNEPTLEEPVQRAGDERSDGMSKDDEPTLATQNERPHFSLSCQGTYGANCDAGDGFDRQSDAEAAGWVDIFEDDGPSWNYLGTCPECQCAEAEGEAADYARAVAWAHNDADEYVAAHPDRMADLRDPAAVLANVRELGEAVIKARDNRDKLAKWRADRRVDAAAAKG